MARERLKDALLRHYTAGNLPAPIGTALDEAADTLVAFFELLIQEDRKHGKDNGTDAQRDSVHPHST